jgi:hypothetical protein
VEEELVRTEESGHSEETAPIDRVETRLEAVLNAPNTDQ